MIPSLNCKINRPEYGTLYSGQKKKVNGPGVANKFFPIRVRQFFLPKVYWYRSSASFPMDLGFFGWVTDFLWFFFNTNLRFQKLQINEKEWEVDEQNTSQCTFQQFATFKMRGWGGKIEIKNEWLYISPSNQRILMENSDHNTLGAKKNTSSQTGEKYFAPSGPLTFFFWPL